MELNELLNEILSCIRNENELSALGQKELLALLEKRIIYLDNDISADSLIVNRFIQYWNEEDRDTDVAERKPIRLMIFSHGGEADAMWSIVDAIMLSKTPVHTINVGLAASAAALIFMAGDKRIMYPNARLLIHEGSASLSGDATKVLDASDAYKKELKRMKEYIMNRTRIPKAQLNKKRNNDWDIDAQYCFDNGVCTEIASSLD